MAGSENGNVGLGLLAVTGTTAAAITAGVHFASVWAGLAALILAPVAIVVLLLVLGFLAGLVRARPVHTVRQAWHDGAILPAGTPRPDAVTAAALAKEFNLPYPTIPGADR